MTGRPSAGAKGTTAAGQANTAARLRDAKPGEMPIVAHRKNDHPWVVIIGAEDFFTIYREWEAGMDV